MNKSQIAIKAMKKTQRGKASYRKGNNLHFKGMIELGRTERSLSQGLEMGMGDTMRKKSFPRYIEATITNRKVCFKVPA